MLLRQQLASRAALHTSSQRCARLRRPQPLATFTTATSSTPPFSSTARTPSRASSLPPLPPPPTTIRLPRSPFSTLPILQKQKGKGFFEPTEPVSEEEEKANKAKEEKKGEEQGREEASKASTGTTTTTKKASTSTSDSSTAESTPPSKKASTSQPAPESASETSPESSKASESVKASSDSSSKDAADGSKSSSGAASGAGSGSGSGSGDGGRRSKAEKPSRALERAGVPDVYPQVLAIPIARRPLFPGFYKAINIQNPEVATAITEMIKRGQPYIGAFLLKDENSNKDVIDDPDEVYDVGVFAQITSAFPVHNEPQHMTAILYPHRRIKLTQLLPPGATRSKDVDTPDTAPVPEATDVPEPIPLKDAEEDTQVDKKGDVVASFEESAVEKKKEPKEKIEQTSFLREYPVSLANVNDLSEQPHDPKSPVLRAVTNEIVNVFKEVASMNPLFREQISTFSLSQSGNVSSDPAKLADFAAAVSAGEPEELQGVLATMDVEDRLQRALVVLKRELMNAKLQAKITKDVEMKITKRQREYWLMEQLKGIKRELGIESDGKDKLIQHFKDKADALNMPKAVRQVFDDEVSKLSHLEPAASEFNVTRNYLDWLSQVPWGKRSDENFDIANAMKVLEEDHYGLKDVKDRILEFIAVGKLRGTVEGKILCFVGPPGVGKTSIGKSIARALNRQYYRFSVGGLTDVAEIKGHRRTYVGALPGRIIQALKKCKTENPLILIDEIDKIGKGYQGDPASALLELLDPEQNNSFLDHYLDVPVDLSKILFVCTANLLNTIPQPLLDRMEVIRLSGYVADEKMAIAEKYLAPQAKELAGLKDVDVNLTRDAIEELIKSYCREAGVRNLKKQIEKLYRKSALQIVQDIPEPAPSGAEVVRDGAEPATTSDATEPTPAATETAETSETSETSAKASVTSDYGSSSDASMAETATTTPEEDSKTEEEELDKEIAKLLAEPEAKKPVRKPLPVPESVHVTIGTDNLNDYVGPPIYTSDRLYETGLTGVAMGLAVSGMGGSAMYVESMLQTALRPGTTPSMSVTGNLRKVMEESSSIAYSFSKGFMVKEFPANHFFDRSKIHVHVPEGAVSKDGPSAGVTIATSLLSLAMDVPVNSEIAMTGELTLTGKVLRIGGLREKTVAAKRAGCKMVLFPKDNMSDWLELSDTIKEGIEGRPISWYHEAFDLVFPDLDREKANHCRICEIKQLEEAKKDKEKKERKRTTKKKEKDEKEDEEKDD